MCLIVDANVASLVFASPPDPEFRPVLDRIMRGAACGQLVHGGQLTDEYAQIKAVRRLVARLDQAGRARQLKPSDVAAETSRLQDTGALQSNDAHILAIARLGKVRLLCSRDQALHADFKNAAILDVPRGSVYQNASHAHLLDHYCP